MSPQCLHSIVLIIRLHKSPQTREGLVPEAVIQSILQASVSSLIGFANHTSLCIGRSRSGSSLESRCLFWGLTNSGNLSPCFTSNDWPTSRPRQLSGSNAGSKCYNPFAKIQSLKYFVDRCRNRCPLGLIRKGIRKGTSSIGMLQSVSPRLPTWLFVSLFLFLAPRITSKASNK